MSLKNRMKVKTDLIKAIEDEEKGNSKDDKRTLNYWDLKFGEKMSVLFVPDTEGNIWRKYRRHAAPKGIYGLESVGCSGKSTCPICQKGFDLFKVAKETELKADKDYAKLFMPNEKTFTSVIVLDSPCDINIDEAENDVKIFYLPFAVEKIIRESLVEEQVTTDNITATPFVIKKTKNQGGKPAYDSSYFARDELTDAEFEELDEALNIEQYDFEAMDFLPVAVDDEAAEAWYEALIVKVEEAANKDANKGKAKADKTSVANRLGRGKPSTKDESPAPSDPDDEQDFDEDVPDDHASRDEREAEEQEQEDEEAPARRPTSSGLRDRLRTIRK